MLLVHWVLGCIVRSGFSHQGREVEQLLDIILRLRLALTASGFGIHRTSLSDRHG